MNIHPPKIPIKFLQWFCKSGLQESILGDLEEQFQEDLELYNRRVANFYFFLNVCRFFRPGIVRNFFSIEKSSLGLLRNYYRVSVRNMLRNKTFSILNITGLSVGIASCLLIFIYVHHELSYDTYHSKYAQTYRVLHYYGDKVKQAEEGKLPDADYQVWGNAAIAPKLNDFFPEIEQVFRFTSPANLLVEYQGKKYQEKDIVFGDATFDQVFDWHWLAGDPARALLRPHTIILSKKLAEKYFGHHDVLGKVLTIDEASVEVTGVYEIPTNSHFSCEGFLSMSTLRNISPKTLESWRYIDFYTYFTINPKNTLEDVLSRIPAFKKKYLADVFGYTFRFEPLADAYLYSDALRKPGPVGNRTNIYVFITVALFILGIACINYMNLSTARSVERAKEVAIRKTIGSSRRALISQLLVESLLMTFLAALVAVVLIRIGLYFLEGLLDKSIPIDWLLCVKNILLLMTTLIGVGVVAGSYPAFVISGFTPITVLKGSFKNSSRGLLLRKTLVVLQFTLTIILILGTVVVYHQLSFLRTFDKGFDATQMLVINFGRDAKVQQSLPYIKTELLKHPAVQHVSASRATPGDFFPAVGTGIEKPSGEIVFFDPALYVVDEHFIPTYAIQILAGRNYAKDYPADSTGALLVNESVAKYLGYKTPEDILGKRFRQLGREGKVIGVVKDFNYQSLHQRVAPLTLRYAYKSSVSMLSVKLMSDDMQTTLDELEEIWHNVAPHYPFISYFNDANFNAQYKKDEKFGVIFLIFSVISIFIACMGLFGLTLYTTNQRAKEIGIRKVLGASTQRIMTLLSYDFVKLYGIAIVIAVPIAITVMDKWLENFAFRTTIRWEVILIAIVGTWLISMATMSVKTLQAALSNPVKMLKDE